MILAKNDSKWLLLEKQLLLLPGVQDCCCLGLNRTMRLENLQLSVKVVVIARKSSSERRGNRDMFNDSNIVAMKNFRSISSTCCRWICVMEL